MKRNSAGKPTPRFRFRLIVEEEYQPLSVVPLFLWALMFVSFALQVFLNLKVIERPTAIAEDLQDPPSINFLKGISFGAPLALSRILMFRLQAFDNQPGISLPYAQLDYRKIRSWLETILELNPHSGYPLMSAARVYSGVRQKDKKRIMFTFVHEAFLKKPNERWRWLAHAAVLTKEDLEDLELAAKYAKDLHDKTDPLTVPDWARQIEIFYRAELTEYDTSIKLIENLLDSGEITDDHEFTFLYERLAEVLDKMVKSGKIREKADFQSKLDKMEDLRRRYLQQQSIDDSI